MIANLTLFTLAITLAPANEPGPAAESFTVAPEASAETALNGPRPFRLSFGLGPDRPVASSAKWFDGLGKPLARLQADRDFYGWLKGLALGVAVTYLGQGGDDSQRIMATAAELQAGATYTWPPAGWRGFLFPYARVSLLLGYARVTGAGNLSADVFLPGVYGGLGLRAHFGRSQEGVPTAMYAFAEAGFAGRYPSSVNLHHSSDESNPLPSQTTPAGRLRLSGWDGCLGLGVSF